MNPEVEMAENGPSLSQRQKGNNLLGGNGCSEDGERGQRRLFASSNFETSMENEENRRARFGRAKGGGRL